MTLPALAAFDDLAARLPGGIDEDNDGARARAALADASALIRSIAGKTWTTTNDDDETVLADDIPDIVVSVCIAAARRAFTNPDGIRSESTGSYSAAYADSSGDVYLTKAEQAHIRRAAGRTGVWAMPTTRTTADADDIYLPVDPPGEPMPFLPADS